MEDLVRVQDVAEQLKLSSATVYRMVKDGRLKGVRVGRSIRIYPESVRALLDTNAVGTAANSGEEE